MKNKGFIATSLIYSFFLLFCAVIVSFITINTHNKNLIDKVNEDIRNDLVTKTVGDASIASYFNINLTHPDYNFDSVKWEVFNKESNSVFVVSDSIIFTTNIQLSAAINYVTDAISDLSCPCSSNIRVLSESDYNNMKANASSIEEVDSFLNVQSNNVIIGSIDSISYVFLKNNTYYNYTFNKSSETSLTNYKNIMFASSKLEEITEESNINKNVRLVIELPSDTYIRGGNGNYSNPYSIKSENCT